MRFYFVSVSALAATFKMKFVAICLAFCMVAQNVAFAADVQVLTHHNNPQRTGANLSENILNPENVGTSAFQLLGSYAVKGNVLAQPLYVSGLDVPGLGARNVLFIATADNMLYAFDADAPGSQELWSFNAGPPADAVALTATFSPHVGITGTPVIDDDHTTIYFVAMTQLDRNQYVHTLHAVNLRTPIHGTPVDRKVIISGNFSGRLLGGNFNSGNELQRAALALIGDSVYIAWSSFDDNRIYDGIVTSYDTASLRERGLFQVNRFDPVAGHRHAAGGIWHSGGGPAIDPQGFFYVVTGNGKKTNGDALDAADVGIGKDLDSSDVKLNSELNAVDYFTPSFKEMLNCRDLDLSVSGPMIPPDWRDRNGALITRLLHGSKQGILYNLNRENLGKFHSDDNSAVQQVPVFVRQPALIAMIVQMTTLQKIICRDATFTLRPCSGRRGMLGWCLWRRIGAWASKPSGSMMMGLWQPRLLRRGRAITLRSLRCHCRQTDLLTEYCGPLAA